MADQRPENLLSRAQSCDHEAWMRICDVYAPIVYRWCRRWGVPAANAGETVRDILVGQGGRLPKQTQPSFRAWLWTTALQHVRRANQGMNLDGISSTYRQALDEKAVTDDTVRMLQRAVSLLRHEFDEKAWQAFVRTIFDKESAAAVAEDLRTTKRWVRHARHHVLMRLRVEYYPVII